jgi:hypothetical protein
MSLQLAFAVIGLLTTTCQFSTTALTQTSPTQPEASLPKGIEVHVHNYGDIDTTCLPMPQLQPEYVLQYRNRMPTRQDRMFSASAGHWEIVIISAARAWQCTAEKWL